LPFDDEDNSFNQHHQMPTTPTNSVVSASSTSIESNSISHCFLYVSLKNKKKTYQLKKKQ
jgi:hypothetical protein